MVDPREPGVRSWHTAAVALTYADDVVLACVRDVHRGALRRTYAFLPTALPPVALVVRVQRRVTEGVYAAVSGGLAAGAVAARKVSAGGRGASSDGATGSRLARSVVNAYVGDRLADSGDPYALTMTVRAAGRDVELTRSELAAAYPLARQDLVVLVHGLAENDESWGPRTKGRTSSYAEDIERRALATPVTLRYNTGRHVSDNGASLSSLLDALVAAWPTPVRRLHLVGHSMGGLVCRSAAAQATSAQTPWVARLATLVSLGSPHLGAPLEQVVHLGARALRLADASRPFADLLDTRSAGIVDLRHGHTSESDWYGVDLSREWGADLAPLAPLPGVAHRFAVATALPARLAPLHRWVGDLMVPSESASGGSGHRAVVADADVHEVHGHHQSLLNHPVVADLLLDWCG